MIADDIIAPFWDDLGDGTQNNEWACTNQGTSPNKYAIFRWDSQWWNSLGQIQAEAILYENGTIVIQYGTVANNFGSKIRGLSSNTADLYNFVELSESSSDSNKRFEYVPLINDRTQIINKNSSYSISLNNNTLSASINGNQTGVNITVDSSWQHYAVRYNNSFLYLFKEGVLVDSLATGATLNQSNADLQIGYLLNGALDELALWNRSLSGEEILDIYKRGALKLNFSVRSCDDAACSGETFVDINDTGSEFLTLDQNQYFQYKAEFETLNTDYSPELYNVTIYVDTQVPSVTALLPTADAEFDTSTTIEIAANITDNVAIDTVYVNITHPDNSTELLNLTLATGTKYNVSFTIPATEGTYNIIYFANDTAGNVNNTEITNFTTTANSAPTITWIQTGISETPTEGTTTTIYIAFNVTDSDGYETINYSSALLTVNFSGETTRQSISECIAYNNDTNTMQLNCSVNMQYYDSAGSWSINVSVKDISDSYAENISTTFTYNQLLSVSTLSTGFTFGTINLGSTSNSTNDPIILNNTGNVNITQINLTAYNFIGQDYDNEYINASQFYANATGDGLGNQLSNNTAINLTGASIPRSSDGFDSNRSIYIWVQVPTSNLRPQLFSASSNWTFEVFG